MNTLFRRTRLTVPSLVLAGVLLKHPNDEGETIYQSVRPVVDDWILVHTSLLARRLGVSEWWRPR